MAGIDYLRPSHSVRDYQRHWKWRLFLNDTDGSREGVWLRKSECGYGNDGYWMGRWLLNGERDSYEGYCDQTDKIRERPLQDISLPHMAENTAR